MRYILFISGTDLLVFNQDPRVVHLLKLTQVYVDFVGQLRDYLSTSTIEIKPILTQYLMSLLQQILAPLSYEPINGQESSSFTLIRPLLDCLFTLNNNPIQLTLIKSNPFSSILFSQKILIFLYYLLFILRSFIFFSVFHRFINSVKIVKKSC